MKNMILSSKSCLRSATCLLLMTTIGFGASAAEEGLDLDQVTTPAPAPSSSGSQKFSLMGRVDLTTETSSPGSSADSEHTLDNNHFFVFLKVKASEKTSFMGEIVNQSFFSVKYDYSRLLEVELGKVIVPFGDTRRFHHFYGGVQGYKASGVMFTNLWAESGVNLHWNFADQEIETYWVDSIQDSSTTADPSLQSTVEPRTIQAVGFRYNRQLLDQIHLIFSGYRGEYQPGKAVEIAGFDLYSEYGAFGLKKLRWAAGMANAWLRKAPVSGDFQKRGDYLEVATNSMGPGESRVRYGTYKDNDKVESQKDTHSLNLGYSMPVDAMRVLTEYQLNFEAINEKKNDLFRIMVSLDF